MLPCLAGCVTSSPPPPPALAEIPADVRACFEEVTARPGGTGALSQREVVAIIGALRASEMRLSGCGRRLVAFYDAQADALAGKDAR